MALPLEPDAQGDDEPIPPFITAPEVRALSMEVIAAWDEFTQLRDALGREDAPIRIAYVFETKPLQDGEPVKTHTIAKVTKASPLWAFLGDVDLVVQFRQPFWDGYDDHQRRAVLHHEHMHIEFPRGRLSLREHDVEDFIGTIRRYGPYLPSRATFVKAAGIWLEENGEPPTDIESARARRPGPSPTHVRRVVDEVVDRVNGGELDDAAAGIRVRAMPGERLAKADGEEPIH